MTQKVEYTNVGINWVKAKTDKAVLLFLITGEEKWVPLTLIRSDYKDIEINDQNLDLPIATWFVEKEGLV